MGKQSNHKIRISMIVRSSNLWEKVTIFSHWGMLKARFKKLSIKYCQKAHIENFQKLEIKTFIENLHQYFLISSRQKHLKNIWSFCWKISEAFSEKYLNLLLKNIWSFCWKISELFLKNIWSFFWKLSEAFAENYLKLFLKNTWRFLEKYLKLFSYDHWSFKIILFDFYFIVV